jgi:hypothetical protein
MISRSNPGSTIFPISLKTPLPHPVSLWLGVAARGTPSQQVPGKRSCLYSPESPFPSPQGNQQPAWDKFLHSLKQHKQESETPTKSSIVCELCLSKAIKKTESPESFKLFSLAGTREAMGLVHTYSSRHALLLGGEFGQCLMVRGEPRQV